MHNALEFLRSVDDYLGKPMEFHEARRQKLEQAGHRRKEAIMGL